MSENNDNRGTSFLKVNDFNELLEKYSDEIAIIVEAFYFTNEDEENVLRSIYEGVQEKIKSENILVKDARIWLCKFSLQVCFKQRGIENFADLFGGAL